MSPRTLPLLPRWLRWFGVVVVGCIILYYSLVRQPTTVASSQGAGAWWDQKLHLAAYGVLTLALAYATVEWGSNSRRIVAVVLIGVTYGIGIEFLQILVPTRYGSPLDAIANVLGVLLASVWFLLEPHLELRHLP